MSFPDEQDFPGHLLHQVMHCEAVWLFKNR